jgi:hypothetical protein
MRVEEMSIPSFAGISRANTRGSTATLFSRRFSFTLFAFARVLSVATKTS